MILIMRKYCFIVLLFPAILLNAQSLKENEVRLVKSRGQT